MKEKKVLPPIFFLGCLFGAVILHLVLPIAQVVWVPYTNLGGLLIGLGFVINVWAAHLFRQKHVTISPFETSRVLVVEGPFRVSRHPMYLGMVLALLGVAMLLGSASALLAPITMFVILQQRFISHEERALKEKFGQAYLAYKHRVRQWL